MTVVAFSSRCRRRCRTRPLGFTCASLAGWTSAEAWSRPSSVFRSLMRSPTPKSHMPVTPQQGWYQLISFYRFVNDVGFAERFWRFFRSRPDLVRQVFTTTDAWNRVTRLTVPKDAAIDVHEPYSGAQYRRLREAWCFSQRDVARLATTMMPEEPVTDDQVGVLERGGNPRRRFLRARRHGVPSRRIYMLGASTREQR